MKYIIFLLLSMALFSYCFSSCNRNEPDLLGAIFSSYKKEMVKSRGYTVTGTGASMPNLNVKSLFMSFKGKEKVDIPEARRAYVELVEGLVDKINADLIIRPYLETYPATWKNTEVHLDFMGKGTPEKNISFISHVNGRIYYSIDDREKKQFVNAYDEPYEEALEIIKKEQENSEK